MSEQWSQARGKVELARETMEDLQSKHSKKWTELTSEISEDADEAQNGGASADESNNGEKPSLLPSAKSPTKKDGISSKLTQQRNKMAVLLKDAEMAQ